MHRTTIYKVLKTRFCFKRKFKIYSKCKALKVEYPRHVILADTVFYDDVFTFIDTFTRESYISIQDGITSLHGKQSLQDAIKYFKQIEIIQNDGEFE